MASIALPVIGWFVSPIFSKVLDHGILHFEERWRLEEGVPEEIDRLSKLLRLIKGVLEDAEQKQTENSGVLFWLGELKEVLYDAEDLLDRYEMDLALTNKSDAEQLPTKMDWKAKIKSINEKLEDLRRQGHEWGLRHIATPSGEQGNSNILRRSRETASFLVDDFPVIGREDEKRAIIKMLGDNKKFSVLPIIGMGGVGKTALARLVFNDQKVQDFFKSKAWVCIGMSQDLDLKRLLIEIINSICSPEKRNKDYSGCSLDLLGKIIVEEIKDKQPFILVLDDAWDTKVNNWKLFLRPLKANNLTCRIIVTTRDQKVADAIRIGRLEPIPLSFLKENDMLKIFRRNAFGNETIGADLELESIGKEIVQRLKGLPLAAEIIGGILHGNRNDTYWRSISKNKLLEIKEDENYMLSILMLSYDSLPADFKQSFLYFALFPKDYTFFCKERPNTYTSYEAPVYKIFSIWMSQKLISTDDEMALYTGSDKIIQLSNKSLLQIIEKKIGPSIVMHDLVHDLAANIAKEEILCVSGATEHNIPNKLRHMSFFEKGSIGLFDKELKILENLSRCEKLRTLLFHNCSQMVSNYTSLLDGWFNNLINLRALSLRNDHMTSLPESIGNLKLLRYLDINLPMMEKLPYSVSNLYNLRVLVFYGFEGPSTLDDSLTRLVNLAYLDIGRRWVPLKNIGKLSNLQHLEEFHVSRDDGYKVTELQNLNKIFGSLHIHRLENIKAKEEAEEAQLGKKDGLKELKLSWGKSKGPEEVQLDVLEGLRPSRNLNKLSLDGYMGTHLPTWFNREDLPFLKAIKLHNCLKLEVLPPLTDCLNELNISMSPGLVEMPSLPPKLQHLSLYKVGVIEIQSLPPKLQLLSLLEVGVTSLFSSSAASQSLPSLRKLEVRWCPNLDGSLCALLKGFLPSLNSLKVWDYKHPLESFCYLTALTKLHLSNCMGKVGIDVRALVSLKDLNIQDCPRATIEDPHPNFTPCTSLSLLEIHSSPSLLRSLSQSRVLLSSLEELTIKQDDLDESLLSGCLLHLTSLKTLAISDCPNITSISEEALCRLVSVESLLIKSCTSLEELDLLALGSLQSLYIENCPRFVLKRSCPQSSSNRPLRDVKAGDLGADQQLSLLVQCSNVKSIRSIKIIASGLGGICQLTTMKNLNVKHCAGLPSEFPSLSFLEKLRIESCPDVTSFPVALNSLRELHIQDCPNFTFSKSPSSPFPSLVRLKLVRFNVQQLTHLIMRVTGSPLRFLEIEGCRDLSSFDGLYVGSRAGLPSEFPSLSFLKKLRIESCHDVTSFPVALNSLREVYIKDCPNFTFSESPSSPFPSLVRLSIGGFNVQQLTHLIMRVSGSPLQFLYIEGCRDLVSFDVDLELPFLYLTSLQELTISSCEHLHQLPTDLQGFKALRDLSLSGCPQISSLPEEGLPTSLQRLGMHNCPALKARYGQRDGNPHWQRISHIPNVAIY